MNAPHIIRLRGPWQRSVITSVFPTAVRPTAKVTMPNGWADDLGTHFCGTVEYQRFFNQPTGIDTSTPISLVFQRAIGSQVSVELNGQRFGRVQNPSSRFSFDISGWLQPRNDLRVQIVSLMSEPGVDKQDEPDPACGGLVGEVCLEIGV